jgi:flagellar motility protein MotE (MotC chaperone)
MHKFLQSTWSAAALGAVTFLATLVLLWRQVPTPTTASAADSTTGSGPGFTLTANPEIDLLIADLRQRSLELDTREQGLRELELRIQAQAAEFKPITQEVARLMEVIDTTFVRVEESEAASLRKQAKIYTAMAPENAAGILHRLDDPAIVKILVQMTDKDMAAVLEAMAAAGPEQTQRVAKLTEMLRLTVPAQPTAPAPGR